MSPERFGTLTQQFNNAVHRGADSLARFVTNLNASEWWYRSRYLRWFFLFLSILFLVCYLYLLFKSDYVDARYKHLVYRREYRRRKPKSLKKYVQRWQRQVEDKLDKEDPEEYKQSILNAAKILDDTLDHLGYQKGNFLDRVDASLESEKFDWTKFKEACRLEKSLRENFELRVEKEKAQEVVRSFKSVLENLRFF